MRLREATFSVVVATMSALNPAASARQPEQIGYACGDVVVVGRFRNNFDYEHVDIENDILGHGWMTARVNVMRHLAGPRPRSRVVVKYFAHTYIRGDRDFLIVLSRQPGSEHFTLESAHLLDRKDDSELASRCMEGRSENSG